MTTELTQFKSPEWEHGAARVGGQLMAQRRDGSPCEGRRREAWGPLCVKSTAEERAPQECLKSTPCAIPTAQQ